MDERDQHIMDFLEGKLSHKEEAALKASMDVDPALKKEISGYERMLQAFKDKRLEAKKQRIRSWKDQGSPIPNIRPHRPWWWYLIAGLAAVGLILLWLIPPGNADQDLFQQYYTLPKFIFQAGTSEAIVANSRMNISAENPDFEKIINDLNQITLRDTVDYTNAQYLLGHAYLANSRATPEENANAALPHLEELIRYAPYANLRVAYNTDSTLTRYVNQYDADWYRALAYLRLGEETTATAILSELANLPESVKQDRQAVDNYPELAAAVLEELD